MSCLLAQILAPASVVAEHGSSLQIKPREFPQTMRKETDEEHVALGRKARASAAATAKWGTRPPPTAHSLALGAFGLRRPRVELDKRGG